MKFFFSWAICWLMLCISVTAQQESSRQDSAYLARLVPYIDSLVLAGQEKYRVPGAVVAIVTDSQHIFYQGYGMADMQQQRQVDKAKTSFRIASISKTFVATAAMQLVEDGKLDLHKDIRAYLPDEQFDFLNGHPITMHQLLTHTAGIDATDIHDAARTLEDIIPLEEVARHHMPDQVFEPGTVHSYSNFGFALAGYVIQAISGLSFADYVQVKILDPLEMSNSSMHFVPPTYIEENKAIAYDWNGGHQAIPKEYLIGYPAGSMNATAKDMANYMLAHLNQGAFKGRRILQAASHQTLTSQKYGSKQTKYGICYAFFEGQDKGRKSIHHGGALPGFLSNFVLIPETGTGIFVSQNIRSGAGGFGYELVRQLIDTLVEARDTRHLPPAAPEQFDQKAKKLVGYYQQKNYTRSTFEKAFSIVGQNVAEFPVTYEGEGVLYFRDIPFVEIEENLFQIVDSSSTWKIQFLTDEDGNGIGFFNGLISYERISWFRQAKVQWTFVWGSLLILFLQLIAWPVVLLWKKLKQRATGPLSSMFLWQYSTGALFVLGVAGIFLSDAIHDQLTDFGVPFSLTLSLLMITIGGISALFSPYALWKIWRKTDNPQWTKALHTFLILVILLITKLFWDYNLVGFHY
ncbi:MAG: serine hydrolase domain-containing protein [Bacteroidota bacterium]